MLSFSVAFKKAAFETSAQKKNGKKYNYSDLWNSLGQIKKIVMESPVNLYEFWVSVGTYVRELA